MKRLIQSIIALPKGPRLIVLVYALGFPAAWLLSSLGLGSIPNALVLNSLAVRQAELWRVFTYGFLAAGPIDWLINLFWLVTLVFVLARVWASFEFVLYCLIGGVAGALPIVLLNPATRGFAGIWAILFALLVAWDHFYRNERLILLGIGEISVRQAALLIAIIDSVILFFSCGGFLLVVSMWAGGAAGWIYLRIRSRSTLGRSPKAIRSERVARLEL